MPGFIRGYGEKGPTNDLKPSGMKEALGPNMEAMEGVPPKIGCAETMIHLDGRSCPKTWPLRMCYHAEIDRSASKDVA